MVEQQEIANYIDTLSTCSTSLLENAQRQWQFGDWLNLQQLDSEAINHPDRAKIILLAAAGHLQAGDMQVARQMQLL